MEKIIKWLSKLKPIYEDLNVKIVKLNFSLCMRETKQLF